MTTVAVIGAGPGGLAAAMRLQSQGYAVDVYERASDVGGRNRTFTLGDYRFDYGPTFLSMVHFVQELFEESGLKAEDYMTFQPLSHMYDLIFADRTLAMYNEPEQMMNELERHFPGSSEGYQTFMREEQKKFDALSPILQNRMDRLWHYMSPRVLRALPKLTLTQSLYDVLSGYFQHEQLKLAFTFQAKYLGMSPWACPGAFSILSYMEHQYGIYHVKGGVGTLTRGMANAFTDLGGRIFTNTPIKRVTTEGQRATGIVLGDGTSKAYDLIVANADFGTFATKLLDQHVAPQYTPKKLAGKKWSCSTFMLYLGVNADYRHLAHHTIRFSDDYRGNVHEMMEEGVLSSDPSFYIHNAAATDDAVAPPGKSAIYLLVPVPNRFQFDAWTDERKAQFREQLLDLVEAKTPFKGLREAIEVEQMLSPNEWSEDFQVYGAATFNLGHQLTQMMYLRPHNRFPGMKNLYLVGGGTHPGSGLPTILESARISARLVCEDTPAVQTEEVFV
ncbi:MAG: phytoene desaturase family protein [Bacilli bacterium]